MKATTVSTPLVQAIENAWSAIQSLNPRPTARPDSHDRPDHDARSDHGSLPVALLQARSELPVSAFVSLEEARASKCLAPRDEILEYGRVAHVAGTYMSFAIIARPDGKLDKVAFWRSSINGHILMAHGVTDEEYERAGK